MNIIELVLILLGITSALHLYNVCIFFFKMKIDF